MSLYPTQNVALQRVTVVSLCVNLKVYHARYHDGHLSEPCEVFSLDVGNSVVSVEQSDWNILFVSGEFGVVLNRQGKIELLKTEQRHLSKPYVKPSEFLHSTINNMHMNLDL